MTIYTRVLSLDAGPATIVPLIHVPLLKSAPSREGEYKVIFDSLGDLCHFYGDFTGYHLYLIASCYRKRIVTDSLDYYDKEKGLFSVTLAMILDSGVEQLVHVEGCQAPLCEKTESGIRYPEHISIEQFSPGTPDALKFQFRNSATKFKFSYNLIPYIPEEFRLSDSKIYGLDIEYIGKAVGENGTREVADRLGNGHSTESLILNEFLHKKTNREAYAIMYKPGRLLDELGGEDKSISYSDVVDTLEKSLIASFLPPKNKQNRNFPNDYSVTAGKLVDSGVRRLLITLASPADYGLLLSRDVEPERTHRFDLKIEISR